jgi:CRISPR/Cas system-associated exonuclease Cas4 (RecB family)
MALDALKRRMEAVPVAQKTRDEDVGGNIGAGMLGGPCDRLIWYKFRWAVPRLAPPTPKGARRMLTGLAYEARVIEDLRTAGYEVHDENPKSTSKRIKQWRVEALGGSVVGYVDGLINLEGEWATLEVKATQQRYANRIIKYGVGDQPKWYAQVQLGLGLIGQHAGKAHFPAGRDPIRRCALIVVNTNTDEWEVHEVPFYQPHFERAVQRARTIIKAPTPPPRASQSPSKHPCMFCDYVEVCHGGVAKSINCRTCAHADVVLPEESFHARTTWHCTRHGRITEGEPCGEYLPISED